ncbi:MAG TPA: DUF2442 domain-containing protein [Spirochaetia bacterium]|nr:MAG: hypothetical protein A2Y41_06465 [Spirochaetes bacterium GWB1_36_13]HCL56795.1 DUF2442 domain-containing protein [Spirochaetia bacterium]
MYKAIQSVKPLKNYQLELRFENGEEKIFNMESYLNHGIFKELKDETLFQTVHVSFDSIEWENGADLDPEILYHESVLK